MKDGDEDSTTKATTLSAGGSWWSPAKKKVEVLVAQLCLTLCNPMDYSPPGSSVQGILQVKILKWVAISFSRGIFPTQGWNLGLLHCRQILYSLSHQGRFTSGKRHCKASCAGWQFLVPVISLAPPLACLKRSPSTRTLGQSTSGKGERRD